MAGPTERMLEQWKAQVLAGERDRQSYLQVLQDLLEETPNDEPQPPAAAAAAVTAAAAAAAAAAAPSAEDTAPPAIAAPQHASARRCSLTQLHAERDVLSGARRRLREAQAECAGLRALAAAQALADVEQRLELEQLRLSRALDKERLLQLLEATDPDAPPPQSRRQRGRSGGSRGGGGGGSAYVPPDHVRELEARADAVEADVQRRVARTREAVASRLEGRAAQERADRGGARRGDAEADALRARLREAETALGATVLDTLRLRHGALLTQRAVAEEREAARAATQRHRRRAAAAAARLAAEREAVAAAAVRARAALQRGLQQRAATAEAQLCMLAEQEREAERVFLQRKQALSKELRAARSQHAELKRRCALEAEGFRRDAAELARRFQKLQQLPVALQPFERAAVLDTVEDVEHALRTAKASMREAAAAAPHGNGRTSAPADMQNAQRQQQQRQQQQRQQLRGQSASLARQHVGTV